AVRRLERQWLLRQALRPHVFAAATDAGPGQAPRARLENAGVLVQEASVHLAGGAGPRLGGCKQLGRARRLAPGTVQLDLKAQPDEGAQAVGRRQCAAPTTSSSASPSRC